MFKRAPLSSTYMLVSLIGFIMSAFLLDVILSWAFAFMGVFLVMFISSVVSMENIPLEIDYLEELAIHDPDHYVKKRKKSQKTKKKN
jgi:hypothetical protein